MNALSVIWTVYRKELAGQFVGMLGYVIMILFVALTMVLTFFFGQFLEIQSASLTSPFFFWHPWLLLFFAPAIGMRLWSEEQRLGTIELLLTMPIAPWQAIVGKFLAACTVLLLMLAATFSVVWTVAMLGDPDNGTIWSGYIASFLFGSGCIAITCAVSAFTRSQVACLIVSFCLCFVLMLIGFQGFTNFIDSLLGSFWADKFAALSMMAHFNDMTRGVITLSNLVFFVTLIGFCLFLTSVVIRSKRS